MNHSDENFQALNLMRALLGSVTPNLRVVAIEYTPNLLKLHFVLEFESSEDREDIDDIVFEFSALQISNIEFGVSVTVDDRKRDCIDIPGRLIYSRKEKEI